MSESKFKILTATFIRALVESNQFDSPGYSGISIDSAQINGDVDLSEIGVANAIQITHSTFDGFLDLSYSSSNYTLDFDGSTFKQGICMYGFQTTKSVLINGDNGDGKNSEFGEFSKRKCGLSETPGSINVNFAKIDGLLDVRGVRAGSIQAVGARVGGSFTIAKSDIDSIDLGLSSFSFLSIIDVNNRYTTRLKYFLGPCAGSVFLDGIQVAQSVYIGRSDFACGVTMTGTRVNGDIKLLGLNLGSLDFTGSVVQGDLYVGPLKYDNTTIPMTWCRAQASSDPSLKLSQSSVGIVRVPFETWPNNGRSPTRSYLECLTQPTKTNSDTLKDGPISWIHDWVLGVHHGEPGSFVITDFRFKSFGRAFAYPDGVTAPEDIDVRLPEDRIEDWLLHAEFAPSEYQLVSDLFRAAGQEGDARRIGFVKKSLETDNDCNALRTSPVCVVNVFSRLVIGYGYCPYAAIFFVAVLTLVGGLAYRRIPDADKVGKDGQPFEFARKIGPYGYSFDMLLPVIKLWDIHYEIYINRPGYRRYFTLHKIFGWLVGLFLVAALSGLAR